MAPFLRDVELLFFSSDLDFLDSVDATLCVDTGAAEPSLDLLLVRLIAVPLGGLVALCVVATTDGAAA